MYMGVMFGGSFCGLIFAYLFMFSWRSVECAIPQTANLCRPRIVALYFLSMEFVSVQAETTCIFQMLYLYYQAKQYYNNNLTARQKENLPLAF